jgi:RNA polymerase sigma factor (sigma-70 family)
VNNESYLLIDECLDELERENPIEAQAVKLHYFVGLPLVEIADVLGVSEVTVRRRHAFAKSWLHDRIRRNNTST